jgi:hypothetical protein
MSSRATSVDIAELVASAKLGRQILLGRLYVKNYSQPVGAAPATLKVAPGAE